MRSIVVGNAQGFWGDSPDAPRRLVEQSPELNYLTLDYLAEVSMSILAVQRERDPSSGYARDFVEVIRSLIPAWKGGRRFRLITNAGGLNPRGCAEACRQVLLDAGLSLRIGIVTGDDIVDQLRSARGDSESFRNLETAAPLSGVQKELITGNAYLGAGAVAEALAAGAEIVVTGRVADPSLTLAACLHEFGWKLGDWDRFAGGTVAGHLIECGTQMCGGISTDWEQLPGVNDIGFPLVHIYEDGSCLVTKPAGTGGEVSLRTVKEQLLYEIGDPGNYLSPDCTVSLLGLQLKQEGTDRVRIGGAQGRPPTDFYKVSASYRNGFWAQGQLTIFGRNAVAKARRAGQVVIDRVQAAGFALEQTSIECLGAGASMPGGWEKKEEMVETVLRVAVRDMNRAAVERFSREMGPLITAGPQGVTGYAAGRPKVHPVFGYWPCLVEKSRVTPRFEIA